MARLDTGWHAHPRVLGLGLAAMGLHAWSISYCDSAQTDGFIPMGSWPALPGIRQAVIALHRSGLWEVCDGGYRLHDYLDYNRSRAEIVEYVTAKRDAGHIGGQASAQARAQRHAQALAQASVQANGQQTLKQNSTPGPGLTPGVNLIAAAAAETPVARAREDGFRPLGALLGDGDGRRRRRQSEHAPQDDELPAEVRDRLAQTPIA